MDDSEILAAQKRAVESLKQEEQQLAKKEPPAPEPEKPQEKQEIEKFDTANRVYFATNAEEMERSQKGLIDWVDTKLKAIGKEMRDSKENLACAKKNKWRSGPFQNQVNKYKEDLEYYRKIKEALVAGYVLVPAFPVQIIAVRTEASAPPVIGAPESQTLPVGAGEYKSTDCIQERSKITNDWLNISFRNFAFPVEIAKPVVMEATAQAMVKKCFDEIGFCGATNKAYTQQRVKVAADPLIIGTVVHAKRGWIQKKCHFLIAWAVNVQTL